MWSSEEGGALGKRFFMDARDHLVSGCEHEWLVLAHHQMLSRLLEGIRILRCRCGRLGRRLRHRNGRVLATVTAKLV
jgi:hypothetical protein